MRVLAIAETGDVSVINTTATIPLPLPVLSPVQVLVDVTFAGVNYYDILERKGLCLTNSLWPLATRRPVRLSRLNPKSSMGSRSGVAFFGSGAYAEYAVVNTLTLAKLPDGVSLEVVSKCFLCSFYFLIHRFLI